MTPESFELLLSWLDTDRERAGEKYEAIRHRLIVFFSGRGCPEADDLADETITRVADKLPALMNGYQGDPTRYFLGVARKVYLEYLRRLRRATNIPPPLVKWSETEFRCLEKCLEKLPPDSREMFEKYYCGQESDRGSLAEQLGKSLNALRISVHRLRPKLKRCVKDCLDREDE